MIESLEIELLAETLPNNASGDSTAEQTWFTQWPNLQTGEAKEIPIAMRWTLTLPKLGDIERLWLLAYDDQ